MNSSDITKPQDDDMDPMYDDPWEHLLVYLQAYKLVICKQCQFAVQPNGIPRHLKDRHHIYRVRRQRLMDWVNGLTLLEPEQISPPPPTESPIRHLEMSRGLACNLQGCRYLCVSVKRMKQHWTTLHGRPGNPLEDWRDVNLQTFFRGIWSRYFVVGANSEELDDSILLRDRPAPAPAPTENHASDLLDTLEAGPRMERDGIEINIEHFRLFKHYSSSTNFTLYHRGEPAGFWKDTVVGLGFQYPYLLHGLLSISALHLAFLHEEQRDDYVLTATHHQDVALPRFRSDLQNVTDENCHAVLVFSRLHAVYTLASIRLLDLSSALTSPHNKDPIVAWLRLYRGNTTLWSTTLLSLKHGPAACLLSQPAIAEAADFSDRRIHHLYCEIQMMYPGMENSDELRTCLDATHTFGRALMHVSNSEDPGRIWEAIEYWVCGLPDLYLDMIAVGRPAALVLLAHTCILLKHLESFWFVGNHAAQFLGLIGARLNPTHQHLILWPVREII